MTETIYLYIGCLLWGSLLGAFYFGGLWLTVKRLTVVKNQALWILGSFVIRNLLVVVGFYPVVVQGWQPTLSCLAGVIVIRLTLTLRIKSQLIKMRI